MEIIRATILLITEGAIFRKCRGGVILTFTAPHPVKEISAHVASRRYQLANWNIIFFTKFSFHPTACLHSLSTNRESVRSALNTSHNTAYALQSFALWG